MLYGIDAMHTHTLTQSHICVSCKTAGSNSWVIILHTLILGTQVPVSEYWGQDKMAAICRQYFPMHFLQWKFRLAILVTFQLPIRHFTGSWWLTYRWFGDKLQQFHPLLMHCSLALSHQYWGPAGIVWLCAFSLFVHSNSETHFFMST